MLAYESNNQCFNCSKLGIIGFFSCFPPLISQSCQHICLEFSQASASLLLHSYSVHNKSWRSLAGLTITAVYRSTKNLTPSCADRQQACTQGLLPFKMQDFSFLWYAAQATHHVLLWEIQENLWVIYVMSSKLNCSLFLNASNQNPNV